MKKLLIPVALVLVLPVLMGCPRTKPAEVTVQEKEVFTITATNTVVAEEEIPIVSQSKMVRADFNMDNLEDMALAEEYDDGRSEISIYLQKRSDNLAKAFFRAGGISPKGEYKITALMSKKGTDHIDLLVIFTYQDATKELVHYRTEGKEFREILRQPIGSDSEH